MDMNEIGSVEESIFTAKVNSIIIPYSENGNKLLVHHVGTLDQEKINTISNIVENQLQEMGTNKGVVKRIFNIVIEALQNIFNHGEKDKHGIQMTFFIIGKTQNDFRIHSGNIVENKNIEGLTKRLNAIKSLNDVDLKSKYMEVLSNGELSDKGGAGLGFLTIALKSNNQINFEFQKLNEHYSLFSLQSKVVS